MADRNFIPVAAPTLGGNERAYVLECLDSTWISSSGRFLDAFEVAFARFCGVSHAVAVNNGTTALHLALTALGIGPGDEVIVPNLTYIASANAVTYCGAKPVFVDCEPLTLNLDPDCIEARITPRTRAILPVHLYGHPADMDRISRLAARHDLHVVEDAAEAHGATYRGRPVGSFGACATFSFYGNKIITTGEGGMVVTDDAALAARLRLYRGQGLDPQRRYIHPVVGFNYRMTNIAAAIGLAQLERIDTILAARRQVAAWYAERLAGIEGLRLLGSQPWAVPVPWLVTVLLTGGDAHERDAVMAALLADGIDSRPLFYPTHQQAPYHEETRYPVAETWSARGLNLPTFEAMTEADVAAVCASLRRAIAQYAEAFPGAPPSEVREPQARSPQAVR
ncbi:DegT/DnrJ/EryC1/StrS family aminotransferase [Methylobacterium sp. J-088]|uniref:DegT/DnrJ/EryC1/StrS family aminotransferase n=1 Tax=unclassified Methylobacterium TaxID=2615210 RepID=UPI001FBB240A|nr:MULTISPECIES: DegT/DnrJ/EryC1/StrS family aminotransferase [unclassified Methylobacterium]MCJ2064653.1 DegT/DnrJ/EryC1/StrS family aminotransferase [Methylobacterium sp. J-088]